MRRDESDRFNAAPGAKAAKKRYELLDTETPRDAVQLCDTTMNSDGSSATKPSPQPNLTKRQLPLSSDAIAGIERIDVSDDASDSEFENELVAPRSVASTLSIDEDTPRLQRSASTGSTFSQRTFTQVAVVALSAISGFLFGYDLCVMVVALPLIHKAFDLSTATAESVISILMVGAVFGSLAGGVVADRIGRKPAIIVTGGFFLLGSMCMTFAESIHMLLLGRFLAGLAVGSSGPCVSTYVAEIATPEHRGALVAINEVMVCVGCLASVIVSSSLQASEDGWRKMLGVTLIPPIVQLAGMPFMPESPRWLISQKGQIEEAKAVLTRFFPHRDAHFTDEQIKAQLATKGAAATVWETLQQIRTDIVVRRRVGLSLLVALAHTFTGANAMLYYSSYIINSLAGHSKGSSFTGVSKELGVAIAKLAGVCTAMLVVDRVGRRPLLLFGSAIMLAAYVLFAFSFWELDDSQSGVAPQESVGIFALYMFIYAWNFSWAPLMLVVCSEVLPDDLRSVGMGMTFAVYWLGSSLVNQTLLTTFDACGMAASFLIYGSLTSASIAFVYWKVPETNGLTFEQITKLFKSRLR